MPNCRDCGEPIVWMRTVNGKNIPVDPDTVDLSDRSLEYDGKGPIYDTYLGHSTHFASCVNRPQTSSYYGAKQKEENSNSSDDWWSSFWQNERKRKAEAEENKRRADEQRRYADEQRRYRDDHEEKRRRYEDEQRRKREEQNRQQWRGSTVNTNPLIQAYQELQVISGAHPSVCKAAYRALALLHHPDRNVSDLEKMKKINNAYDYLRKAEIVK